VYDRADGSNHRLVTIRMTVLVALLLATPPLAPAGALAGPTDASSGLCGNGRIDTFSGPVICAPCIPNRPCRCAPTSITEECDRADLGGRTCASIGFLAGTLRCAADCRLDRTGCETAASKPPFARVATIAEALPGRDFALARRGDVLGAASTETGAVRLRTFDAATLAPRGESAWRPPATAPPGAFGLDAFQRATVDPLWSPALAALGDGFVLAAERAASSAYTVLTFRAAPGGAIGAPVASFPGRHPFFLVPGGDGALLGYWWRGVQVVRVGADGHPLGEPVSIDADGTIPPAAAAFFAGDGWVVVTAAGVRDQRLRVTRVGLDGGARAAATLEIGPISSLAIAGDTEGVVVAYARIGGGVFALPLPPPGAPAGQPIRVCDGLSVLAAERLSGHLVVWAGAASGVVRADLRLSDGVLDVAPVLSAPRLEPAAALLDRGAFLVFTAESGKPSLYGAR
jgi:hypothetical protein